MGTEQFPTAELIGALIGSVLFGTALATIITRIVNKGRQTSGLAKATLFCSILGLTTVVPLFLAIPLGHLALRQIRRSGGVLKGKLQARFGLTCGYAALVLTGYQLYLGLGDIFRDVRNSDMERANLQLIEGAKAEWAAAHNKAAGDVPSVADLAPFMPGGQFPNPVEGETYEIRPIGVQASVVRPPPTF